MLAQHLPVAAPHVTEGKAGYFPDEIKRNFPFNEHQSDKQKLPRMFLSGFAEVSIQNQCDQLPQGYQKEKEKRHIFTSGM